MTAKDLTGANRDNREDLRKTPFPQFTRRGGLSSVSPIRALFSNLNSVFSVTSCSKSEWSDWGERHGRHSREVAVRKAGADRIQTRNKCQIIIRHKTSHPPPSPEDPALYEQTKKNGWTVIRMKDDWETVFAFENK